MDKIKHVNVTLKVFYQLPVCMVLLARHTNWQQVQKPSVSHLRVLFCPSAVRKATAHVETKTLNIRHQAQKGFRGIFVGIPQHQKGYLLYVPSTRKVILSYDVVSDKSFYNALSYTS